MRWWIGWVLQVCWLSTSAVFHTALSVIQTNKHTNKHRVQTKGKCTIGNVKILSFNPSLGLSQHVCVCVLARAPPRPVRSGLFRLLVQLHVRDEDVLLLLLGGRGVSAAVAGALVRAARAGRPPAVQEEADQHQSHQHQHGYQHQQQSGEMVRFS